jgi:hypothetical protein
MDRATIPAQMSDAANKRLEDVLAFQSLLIAHATEGVADDTDFRRLRGALIAIEEVRELVPQFVRANRTAAQFWEFIKHRFATYRERREFIYSAFHPILDRLESDASGNAEVDKVLATVNSDTISAAWTKALERRKTDPDGAITAARTLLESVCKHILDDKGVTYSPTDDLPKLYNQACQQLNLAPSQHAEDVFKRILGGCTSVVEGLGSLRNKLGDAHGQGRHAVRPAARHAGLAVNLAGSMAMFLVETLKK